MVIAIDGPAGSGKSTTAMHVASKLGFIHINTGSMYRAIALKCINNNIVPSDLNNMEIMLNDTSFRFCGEGSFKLLMDNEEICSDIFSSKVTSYVSQISAIPLVRMKLVKFQREMSKCKNVVLEGRDIGTIVFPNARFKFFLIADIEERARRRKKDIESEGGEITIKELIHQIDLRDEKDSNRDHSPLKKANDAIVIDTTDLSIEEQVNYIVGLVNNNNK